MLGVVRGVYDCFDRWDEAFFAWAGCAGWLDLWMGATDGWMGGKDAMRCDMNANV